MEVIRPVIRLIALRQGIEKRLYGQIKASIYVSPLINFETLLEANVQLIYLCGMREEAIGRTAKGGTIGYKRGRAARRRRKTFCDFISYYFGVERLGK